MVGENKEGWYHRSGGEGGWGGGAANHVGADEKYRK